MASKSCGDLIDFSPPLPQSSPKLVCMIVETKSCLEAFILTIKFWFTSVCNRVGVPKELLRKPVGVWCGMTYWWGFEEFSLTGVLGYIWLKIYTVINWLDPSSVFCAEGRQTFILCHEHRRLVLCLGFVLYYFSYKTIQNYCYYNEL